MTDRLVVDQQEFEDLCNHFREAGIVAFDTEFVSESTFQPDLCLLQFATNEQSAGVDPFELDSLESWWEIMADDKTTIVVHGGQAEIRFCRQLGGRSPRRLIDVQLAEGMRSTSYPLGYGALVSRVLGKRSHGKETRTDWRRRPLSERQVHYAMEDVEHLLPIWNAQRDSLKKLNRFEWAEEEFQRMIDDIETDEGRDKWQKVSGIHRLRRRELAVAIELSRFRESEAERRNQPLRRILRDDLLIELARRQPVNSTELFATRDMNRTHHKRAADDLIACIERARAIPDDELPSTAPFKKKENSKDEHVLGQLLAIALSNRCAEVGISKQLVGTSAELKRLVRHHVFSENDGRPPRLTEGWRAEVCGDLLTDLLDGKISLRVADAESDHPLVFEPREQ